MRVLLISHTCQSITEGQPKAHALAALGEITLRVLVPDRWRVYGTWISAHSPAASAFEYQVERIRFPWMGPAQNYLHYYPGLGKILREFRPDVIDVWEEPWSLMSFHVCRLRAKLAPGAKIVSETEQNIDKRLPFPFEYFRSRTLACADFVVGRSSEAVEVVRGKGYQGPARAVPNAVDEELFRPLDRAACRRDLGLSGFVLGYVGRLVEEKGLLDLIEALADCPADVNALIVGDGPLRERLISRAGELGVTGRLRLLPGRAQTELPPLMNAMDALALLSHTTGRWKEQFGRVVIEANSCGVPVIGSDSGAIAEVVGSAGLIVREKSPGAVAAAIQALRNDPRRRQELGQIGRRQVLEKYTWHRVAQRMHEIYHTVLAAAAAQ